MSKPQARSLRALRAIAASLVVVGIGFELGFLFSSVSTLRSSRRVLMARDNDVIQFLDTTRKTEWFNDAKGHYGPLYYRLSASVQKLVPIELGPGGLPIHGAVDRSYHHAMLLTTVFSLLLITAVIAASIPTGAPERLAFFGGLLYLLLSFEEWARYAFRAHTELLLTLLVCLGTWFGLRIGREGRRLGTPRFYLAAICFGLAATAKVSAGVFAAGYLLLLLLPGASGAKRSFFEPLRWFEALLAGSLMLAVYALVGYPQTSRIFERLRTSSALLDTNSQAFSWGWAGSWLLHFLDYAWAPVLLLFLAGLLFGADDRRGRPRVLGESFWALGIPGLALATILKTQLVIPTTHYVIAVVASLLVVQAVLQQRWLERVRRRLALRPGFDISSPVAGYARVAAIALVGCFLVIQEGTPAAAAAMLHEQKRCIPAANEMLKVIRSAVRPPRSPILADPYFPVPRSHRTRVVWGKSQRDLDRSRSPYLGISESFAERFLAEDPDYLRELEPFWKESQTIYRRFHGQTTATDLSGRRWELVRRTGCGYALWRRVGREDEAERPGHR
jgi:hypothetical protein